MELNQSVVWSMSAAGFGLWGGEAVYLCVCAWVCVGV